jgi:hypothetical protein
VVTRGQRRRLLADGVLIRCERSTGAGEFATVLKYANLPEVRAWRAHPQLDFAGVFAVRKPESILRVLFSEISTRQKARAVPASGVYAQGVFTPHRSAAAGQ